MGQLRVTVRYQVCTFKVFENKWEQKIGHTPHAPKYKIGVNVFSTHDIWSDILKNTSTNCENILNCYSRELETKRIETNMAWKSVSGILFLAFIAKKNVAFLVIQFEINKFILNFTVEVK